MIKIIGLSIFIILCVIFMLILLKKEKIKTESNFFEDDKKIYIIKQSKMDNVPSFLGLIIVSFIYIYCCIDGQKDDIPLTIMYFGFLLICGIGVLKALNFKIEIYNDYLIYHTTFKNIYTIEYKGVLKYDIWRDIIILKTENKHFILFRSGGDYSRLVRRLNKDVIHYKPFSSW